MRPSPVTLWLSLGTSPSAVVAVAGVATDPNLLLPRRRFRFDVVWPSQNLKKFPLLKTVKAKFVKIRIIFLIMCQIN